MLNDFYRTDANSEGSAILETEKVVCAPNWPSLSRLDGFEGISEREEERGAE